MIADLSYKTIVAILIAYFSIYIGYILGKWSNDELKYKNYFYAYLWIFILFSCICFALNYYLAAAIIFICYLLLKTTYIWNLMFFIIGISLTLTSYFEFTAVISSFFAMSYGAMVRTIVVYQKKKERHINTMKRKKQTHEVNILKRSIIMSFLNSLGLFLGVLMGVLIRFIF